MHRSTYFEAEAALISPRLSRILKLSRGVASCYWSLLERELWHRASSADYIIDFGLTPKLISFRTRPKFLLDAMRAML